MRRTVPGNVLRPPIGVVAQADGLAAAGALVPLGRLNGVQLGVLTRAERLVLTPVLVYRSERPRAPTDPRPPLDPYVRVDLNLRVLRVFRSLELWATAFNLFDKRYSDPAPPGGVPGDYPRPGRALFVGAGYKF